MRDQFPLNICLVSEEYPPDTGWGGIGTYTYNLARGLARIGHRVDVIAGALENASLKEEEGVRVHRIGFAPPSGGKRRILWRAFQVATRKFPYYRRKLEFARAAMGAFRSLGSGTAFDVVEAAEYDANAFYISKMFRTPLVVKIHTPLLLNTRLNELPVTQEVRLCDRLERAVCRRARLLTTPSSRMAAYAAGWLRNSMPAVIPNPIDTDEFSPAAGSPDLEYDFFYTGRLEKRKGVHLLLQAFRTVVRQHPDARLFLAGHDTPTFPHRGKALFFMEYAEQNKLLEGIAGNVVFLGRVDRRELPAHYRKAKVCVFPSEKFENFPYSCLEAMSCGRPVVVSDSGGMTEMMEDGLSGFKVAPGKVDELAKALLNLAASPELRERMGRAARQRVENHYTMEHIAGKTVEAYRQAIVSANSRPTSK